MTPEELDKARVEEAYRIWHAMPLNPEEGLPFFEEGHYRTAAFITARLCREGWMPINPAFREARAWAAETWPAYADGYQRGRLDHTDIIKCYVAGYNSGRSTHEGT